MNTLHLTYAVEVERCGSITQAADNLYMAQPNLSKAIRELEESMGFAIFMRTSRGVTPTARGREFLGYARAILAQVRRMESLSGVYDGTAQRFSLVLPHAGYADLCFSQFMDSLDAQAPMDVRVKEAGAHAAVSEVADGRYQLGIVRYDAAQEASFQAMLHEKMLTAQPLQEHDAQLLLSARHPLAASVSVALSELAPYAEVHFEGAAIPRREESPRRVTVSAHGQMLDLLSRLPGAYAWSAPEPSSLLSRHGLVLRPCPERGLRLRDALIYPVGYRLSPLDERFRALLTEACEQL